MPRGPRINALFPTLNERFMQIIWNFLTTREEIRVTNSINF